MIRVRLGSHPKIGDPRRSPGSLPSSLEAIICSLCVQWKIGVALELHNLLLSRGIIPCLSTYNQLIKGLSRVGALHRVWLLLNEMQKVGASPDHGTHNALVEGYCQSKYFDCIDGILSVVFLLEKCEMRAKVTSHDMLVATIYRRGSLECAQSLLVRVLEECCYATLISFTRLIHRYCKQGDMINALEIWRSMLSKGIDPDNAAYNALLNGFHIVQDMKQALRYFCEMIKKSVLPDTITFNILMTGLCKAGQMEDASAIFKSMHNVGIMPDQTSYEMVIQGFCLHGDLGKAVDLLSSIISNYMVPEVIVWNTLISAYGKQANASKVQLLKVQMVKAQMVKCGVLPNVFTYNLLIDAYLDGGNFKDALSLKEEMILCGILPDATTFNLLIFGAFKSLDAHLALELFDEMQSKAHPDIITYTTLIQGFCMTGEMKLAEEVFALIYKTDASIDHVPYLIFIKEYCRRGELNKALNLYDDMVDKGIANTISVGHEV